MSQSVADVGESLRRNDEVLVRVLDGEAFLAHPATGAICRLNATGAAIWQLLDEPTSLEGVVAALAEAFPEIDLDRLRDDVGRLIDMLRGHAMVHAAQPVH